MVGGRYVHAPCVAYTHTFHHTSPILSLMTVSIIIDRMVLIETEQMYGLDGAGLAPSLLYEVLYTMLGDTHRMKRLKQMISAEMITYTYHVSNPSMLRVFILCLSQTTVEYLKSILFLSQSVHNIVELIYCTHVSA